MGASLPASTGGSLTTQETGVTNWKPPEIIINDAVRDDPVTIRVVQQHPACPAAED